MYYKLKRKRCQSFLCLYESGFEESGIGAVFLDGAHAAGGDFYIDGFIYFRHKNSLLLKIQLFSNSSGWVELSGAGAV